MRSRRMTMIVVTVLGMTASTDHALSQQKTLREQLLGAWDLVSFNSVHADGSKLTVFGGNPNGIAFFDSTGHYIITVMRSDRAKFAANDRTKGTADEYKATAEGTITYFGTYTVNEADRALNIHVAGSSFPNWNGTDQKRTFAVSADELKLTNPVASTGGTTEVVWKRAR
ncbi:MAG TPA: lipocalin-like domain-containing protein [Xanthobacteraceae bacterium]|nr:lipocalin-like domain-containing protein [Xanthobacteraceae bacterium]